MKFLKLEPEIKPGRKQFIFSENDDFILFRKHILEFAEQEIANWIRSNPGVTILEVGPSPETHIIKKTCELTGSTYETLDIEPAMNCTYTGRLEQLSNVVRGKTFDAIIILSVLEHIPQVHRVPFEVHFSLKTGGKVFINVPWAFKIHGPIPDCWRISTYGLNALFHDFEMEYNIFPENEIGKNSMPLSINAVGTKR